MPDRASAAPTALPDEPIRPWPVELRDRELLLRPLRRRDRREFTALRTRNEEWLRPWDASDPDGQRGRPRFSHLLRWQTEAARRGAMLPFAIEARGRLVGQITAGPVQYGSMCTATIGYWVGRDAAGQGIAPRALALLIDHCFAVGLHRIEVEIRPENTASLRVAQKLHLREEGLRRRSIHVDGAWRDHRSFALTTEDVREAEIPGSVLARLLAETGRP